VKQGRGNSRILQWDELFPKQSLWNRAKDFQLKYEDMNLVLEKKSNIRIPSFNRKDMEFF
jgi:hypothetical protein